MASITQYSLNPTDTSFLSYSGAQELVGISAANTASDLSFSYYLQTLIDRLDKSQNAAISSVDKYVADKSSANMDALLSQLNAVNSSLKDMLLMRTQMMQAYQNTNPLGL
ncbi:flagellar hook-basal body complex protein FliE [Polynucleobacter sp. AP-Kolm-20A-A1]|uniref:flagellar hook-basal body complex protein FliE n=1 Tax=Polynucleobacter sp. AP-Kolm-20A-A1 TaxID=2081041 RepID=UPI001BFE1ABE|nr:flagellar hook-basal body complex protein FliE [Polynucleobacter sp. AP-Kolm-20A-A1]QWE21466.1 flagellar hook-basal body complex protein FliE [Polynucleobacter sp. AP-Kolm-20A-A1]